MARREYGTGSICKRTVARNGAEYVYWRAIIPAGTHGRRIEKQSRSRRKLEIWLKANAGGPVPEGASVTLGVYAVDWLRDTSLTVKPATTEFYRHSLRHLEDVSELPIAALTPAHVRELIAQKTEAGLSPRTVRGVVQTLADVLGRAQRDGIVERNVARLVKLPRPEPKVPRHFTAAQARRFLDAAKEDELGALYATALGTGLRRGELLALTWRDVHLRELRVDVRSGKTRSATRQVPLPEFAALALAALPRGTGPIWQVRPEYVSKHFGELCRRAGVPALNLHELRHTAASLMLDAGVDPLVIQQVLGHSRVTMTAHYARSGDALRRDAVDRLAGQIAGHSHLNTAQEG